MTVRTDAVLLGLSVGEALSAERIRKAFLHLALQHHPDKAGPEERRDKTELFQQIRAAHDRLIGRAALPPGAAAGTSSDIVQEEGQPAPAHACAPQASPAPSTAASSSSFFHEPTDSQEIRDAKRKLKRKGCDQLLGAALSGERNKRATLVRGMSTKVALELERELRAREVWRSFFRAPGPFSLDLARCSATGSLLDRCYRSLALEFASRKPEWKQRQAGPNMFAKAPAGLQCLTRGRCVGWEVQLRNKHGRMERKRFLLRRWKSWQLCFRLAELQLAVWRRRDADSKGRESKARRKTTNVPEPTAAAASLLATAPPCPGLGRQTWHTTKSGAARIEASAFGARWSLEVNAGESNPAELAVAEVLAVGLKHRIQREDTDHFMDQARQFESELFGGWPLPFSWVVKKKAGGRTVNSAFFPVKETCLEALDELNSLLRQGWSQSASRTFQTKWGAHQVVKEPTLADEKALSELLRAHAGEPVRRWRCRGKRPPSSIFREAAMRGKLAEGAASSAVAVPALPSGSPPALPGGVPLTLCRSAHSELTYHHILPFLAGNLPLCERLRQLEELRSKGSLNPEQHAVAVTRTLAESWSSSPQVPVHAQRLLRDQQVPKSKWPEVWMAVVHHRSMKQACAQAISDVVTRLTFNMPLISSSMVDSNSESRQRKQGLFT